MPALCDVPTRRLEISCVPCGRHGFYGVQRLMHRFSEHGSVYDVYRSLVATCRAGGACQAVLNVEGGVRMPSNPRSRA